MKAIRQNEFGPAETLTYTDVPDPEPGAGQLRIAVTAAGVHLLDAAIRAGTAGGHPFADPSLPMTPGREVAGTVDRVGDGVDPRWLGRRVVTHLGIASGGYAELAVRETEAVHTIPDGLSDQDAVAMIGTGRTALGVLDQTWFGADDVAVITSAAGGVGALLVQAAEASGATVVGLAGGPAKTATVNTLASGVIAVDYTADDWTGRVRDALAGRQVTVVVDSVGGAAGRDVFDLLGVGGRFFILGWSSGEATKLTGQDIADRSLQVTSVLGPRLLGRGLRELETEALSLAESGRLRPLTQVFPLAEAARAHRALESRATTGKVILVP